MSELEEQVLKRLSTHDYQKLNNTDVPLLASPYRSSPKRNTTDAKRDAAARKLMAEAGYNFNPQINRRPISRSPSKRQSPSVAVDPATPTDASPAAVDSAAATNGRNSEVPTPQRGLRNVAEARTPVSIGTDTQEDLAPPAPASAGRLLTINSITSDAASRPISGAASTTMDAVDGSSVASENAFERLAHRSPRRKPRTPDVETLPFSPRIDKRSEKLVAGMRDDNYNLHEELYHGRESREQHRAETRALLIAKEMEACPFHPETNDKVLKPGPKETFDERLAESIDRKKDDVEEMRKGLRAAEDEEHQKTCTFHPEVNKKRVRASATPITPDRHSSVTKFQSRMEHAREPSPVRSPRPASPQKLRFSGERKDDLDVSSNGTVRVGRPLSPVRSLSRPVLHQPRNFEFDISLQKRAVEDFTVKEVTCPYCRSRCERYYLNGNGGMEDKSCQTAEGGVDTEMIKLRELVRILTEENALMRDQIKAGTKPETESQEVQTDYSGPIYSKTAVSVVAKRPPLVIPVRSPFSTPPSTLNSPVVHGGISPTNHQMPPQPQARTPPPPVRSPAGPPPEIGVLEATATLIAAAGPIEVDSLAHHTPTARKEKDSLSPRSPNIPNVPPVNKRIVSMADLAHIATALPMARKRRLSHRDSIKMAGKDVNIVLMKISAAVGDSMRMKAALMEAQRVMENITETLLNLQANVEDDDKKKQITDLAANLGVMTRELDAEVQVLVQDPHNERAKNNLQNTLKALEDAADIALAQGTSAAVKVDLREAVVQVPVFDGLQNAGFVNLLVRKMRHCIYAPNQFIVKAREEGSSMYFITKGNVSIMDPDGTTIVELHEGSFFGEIAVLVKGARTASALATTYVEAYELDKQTLDGALTSYPEYKEHFQTVAAARLYEDEKKRIKGATVSRFEELATFRFRASIDSLRQSLDKASVARNILSMVKPISDFLLELCHTMDVEWLAIEMEKAKIEFADRADNDVPADELSLAANRALNAAERVITLREAKEFLDLTPMFQGTDTEFRAKLHRGMEVVHYPSGKTVVKVGSHVGSMFFIIRGSVSITLPGGKRVGNLNRGYAFGENAFHEDLASTADVTSNSPIELVRLDKDVLDAALVSHPEYESHLAHYFNEQKVERHKLRRQASSRKALPITTSH